jgi:transposase
MLVTMERPAPDLQTVDYAASRERPWRRATYKWEPAVKNVRFVGLDVHAETIAVAVAEVGGEVRSLGVIPNRAESVRRLVGRLGKPQQLRVCYEAGPTGYVLYWQLSELGVHCEVVAPTLVPVKAGDRVKTDRRDAEKLARCYRAGDLTAVWVPDAAHEALRDLVRARLAAKRDQLRARHRLGKFLLRQGRRAPEGTTAWTGKYLIWVKQQCFEHAAQETTLLDYLQEVEHAAARIVRLERGIDTAVESMPESLRAVIAGLQCLRGVAKVSAVTLVSELGQLSRFAHARQLMGYAGMVSREHSSGERVRRGSISKAGNAHLRRIVTEAAWSYRHRPNLGATLIARQSGQSEVIKAIAWRAQQRLHARYRALLARGKTRQKVITALGRELLGFIWAIGCELERTQSPEVRRAA